MSFLLYGAYGYTGQLIAREAVRRGQRPVLAGRDEDRLHALADELDLPARAFALDDVAALDEALETSSVVLHAAGPFAQTARPMMEGCLRTGTHYLDITGEIEVFELLARQDGRAREAGVTVLPGVGFDVVPTDCLAAHLKQRLPEAAYLELAIQVVGGVSRGTAKTAVRQLGEGGVVRRNGTLTPAPAAWRTRAVDFGRGLRTVVSIPWGDVATAYHTTGIPNVVVYARVPEPVVQAMKASRFAGPLLRSDVVQRQLTQLVDAREAGPSDQLREEGRTGVWGQAATADGRRVVTSRLHGPESYTLTAQTSLNAVARVADGQAPVGFQTPGGAFGADFVLEVDGVRREDLR